MGDGDTRERIEAFAARHGLDADAREELASLVASLGAETWAAGSFDPGADATLIREHPEVVPPSPASPLETRYEQRGQLGVGGMGEVVRVHDALLKRIVAMKIVRRDLLAKPRVLARFQEEAQVSAQLQHPGIVPIHDLGFLPDGRPYFTMKEVRGRTLADVIHEVHDASLDGPWAPTATGWTFRRLIDAFRRAAEAVAYAHARGVIHRDLKPSNIMVGDFGEVLVLDWGLAKLLGELEAAEADPEVVVSDRSRDGLFVTRMGTVTGTPAYMAPEQARGELDQLGPRTDVYALGAILYTILWGIRPWTGLQPLQVVAMASQGHQVPIPEHDEPPVPPELRAVCEQALQIDAAARPADAGVVAAALRDWLEGARRREQALAVVEEADARRPAVDRLRARAAEMEVRAKAELAAVPSHAPAEDKEAAWALEDEARALREQADAEEVAVTRLLEGALTQVPDLPEAHDRLADEFHARHAAAEARGDRRAAARWEAYLRGHDRGRYATYLAGDGALTLVTDPPGAEVTLHRYVEQKRRLVPVMERVLGETPLVEVPLAMGSYLLTLRASGRAEVRYPVLIGRGEHWDGVRPGSSEPFPIRLPAEDELGPDDCYVPAGWFWCGGEMEVVDHAMPWVRLWADACVIKRYPVTNVEYIAFLDDLVQRGREDEALRCAPRAMGAAGDDGALLLGRGTDGRFLLQADESGDAWLPDVPVVAIDGVGTETYVAWVAERTGGSWRLPGELEWEKGARGADGRIYPWGPRFDPAWCNMRHSRPRPLPGPIGAFPVDRSPYGIADLAGNVMDRCRDPFPDRPHERGPLVTSRPLDGPRRAARGGTWSHSAFFCRADLRQFVQRHRRPHIVGIRLARDA